MVTNTLELTPSMDPKEDKTFGLTLIKTVGIALGMEVVEALYSG